jgi:hypothetical protein
MNREELSDYVHDFNVHDTFRNAWIALSRLPPNGAIVHRKNNCMFNLHAVFFLYELDGNSLDETFGGLQKKDPDVYERRIGYLLTALSFGIEI